MTACSRNATSEKLATAHVYVSVLGTTIILDIWKVPMIMKWMDSTFSMLKVLSIHFIGSLRKL